MSQAPATLVEMFVRQVERGGDRPALWTKVDGRFEAISWRGLGERVGSLAAGLVRAGVLPGDRVVQLSENRWEWVLNDLAIQMAQGVHVPLHAPLTAEQVSYQVLHCGARYVLVSDGHQLSKLAHLGADLERIRIYVFEPVGGDVPANLKPAPLAELWQDANADQARDVQQRALDALTPQSLATILYTSGTTGEPKGVMLSQHNLVSNALATLSTIGYRSDDLRLNLLPLSHIFARTCDLYTWLAAGTELALAESRETVMADCAALHPTVLNAVPYFYDRVRRAVVELGRAGDPLALRELLGGRLRLCCSGGAALPDHVFDFYRQRGLPILQGYGLTETSPVISVSSEADFRPGASGRPLPGVEVRLAEDGEILTRGPHLMQGYYRDQEATAAAIREGWFYTGDLGRLDEDGYLYITGRKKEIIVTSGGKNIAPVMLEALLTEDPAILQAMVVGDDRPWLAALIVPAPEALQTAARELHLEAASPQDLLQEPQIVALFEARVQERLRSVSYYEQVRRVALLPRGFSLELEELTPKLSLRRKVIEAHFAQEIEALYAVPRKTEA